MSSVWTLGVLTTLLLYEIWALVTAHPTISRLVVELTRIFPLLPYVAGGIVSGVLMWRWARVWAPFTVGSVVGALAVHFWWHWCP